MPEMDTKITPRSTLLSAEVQSLLDTGIDVYVQTVLTDNDSLDGPKYLRFRLDREFFDWANDRFNACIACGFSEAKVRLAPADYHRTSDVGHILGWEITFDGSTSFCFTGETKGGNHCESVSLSQEYLTNTLNEIASTGDVDDGSMIWHGSCLFHSEDDVEELLEQVLEIHPEVGAAETAKQMASAIAAAPPIEVAHQAKAKHRRASI